MPQKAFDTDAISKVSPGLINAESVQCQGPNAVNESSKGVSLLNPLADEFLPAS